jgi:hypothetical protein
MSNLIEFRKGINLNADTRRLLSIADAMEGSQSWSTSQRIDFPIISVYLRAKALGWNIPTSIEQLALAHLEYMDVKNEVHRLLNALDS